ncbi:MAG TPA: PQQ-binding-like beta-propeller repeat protein [Thermoanaerobaculia bacterium]|nr:PQQ-binding-like beta-propeller repeat protein [Thermoanaerobaculia bacterium]
MVKGWALLVLGAVLAIQIGSVACGADGAAGPPAATAATAGTAAQFRGGPEHTGMYPGTPPRDSAALRWSFPTAGPVRSTPLVAGGTVYLGSGDGSLYALDAATGQEKWRFATGGAIHSSPALAGGAGDLVLFASRDRRFYALDAQTGRQRWSVVFGPDLPFAWAWDYFLSSPAVVDGRVFVGSGDGNLYALEAATGKVLWKLPTHGRVRSSPAVAGGVVYVGSLDGRLYAADAADGHLRWTFEPEGVGLDSARIGFDRTSLQSSPAVAGNTVVFGSRDGFLYAVDTATGHRKWRFDHQASWVISSPAVENGMVYVGTSDGHFVQAVDLASGREKWHFATGDRVFASPALAAGTVYFTSRDRNLYALDAATGAERFRYRTGDQAHSSPVVAGGVLYFGSDDGKLYALAAPVSRSGKPLHRAVFWNERARWKYFKGDAEVRDFFRAQGYQPLSAETFAPFLDARIADHEPSVVVLASDTVPEAGGADSARFRRYLDSGGKVVCLAIPPFLALLDPATGKPIRRADPKRAQEILGLDLTGIQGDEQGVRATPEGVRWGLPASWVGGIALPPAPGLTVLGRDENGRAAAWVKSYGGPEGTGLVGVWGREYAPENLEVLLRVAEYGLGTAGEVAKTPF